ncbi:MAG: RNA polymerase sigma factor [Candidatus Korobacteraceae bacterium]
MDLPFFGSPKATRVAKAYAELAAPLLSYARSLGLDRGTAEDIVQRTFLVLLNGNTWPSEPRPYLFRAVRNASLNQIRDRLRDTELPAQEPWFQTKTVDRFEELDLRRALIQLPEEQREVVMMHVWGGLSFQEVASAIGVSANTAASRYRYAIASLRRLLTPAKAEENKAL